MSDADAIHFACPRCNAQPGFECVNPTTGLPARCSCVTRVVGRPVSAPPKHRKTRRP